MRNTLLTTLLLFTLTAGAVPADTHEDLNPIYRDLRAGLKFSSKLTLPLPAPTMPDGLTGDQQLAIIRKLAGQDYSIEELTRKSIVAPQILRINKLTPNDPTNPPRLAQAWFIAYGDLKKVNSRQFLDRLVSINKGQGKGKSLDKMELEKRGITIAKEHEDYESYGHGEFDLFQRVRIEATGRSFWSETADSIITASQVDPRFMKDPQYPNRWRSLSGPSGNQQIGPPHPYQGVGYYMKITRLESPPGALFVEAHIGFGEPSGWFNDANMLRSKLPKALETKVRDIRREFDDIMQGK